MLAALRASTAIEVVGVLRSTRIQAWRRYRASGLVYTLYLGCLMARRLGAGALPVLPTADVNGEPERVFVERLSPDLLVSAFFHQRIGEQLTALPRLAALSIHPSLLPAFKGVDPVFHARLAGAPALGVSVHRLSPELDSGDLVSQKTISWSRSETVLRLTERLYVEGAELLVRSLGAIGAATPTNGPGNCDSWPTRDQVAELRAGGVKLVAWRDLLTRAA